MPFLDDLPADILYEIHHLSQSEHLPLVNRYLHAVLSHPTTTRAAYWLIDKYHPTHGDSGFLPRALECAVCDLDVLRVIERIWTTEQEAAETQTPTPWFRLTRTTPPRTLQCPTLPKRIFRPRSTTTHLVAPIHPLLTHLTTTYRPSPNSHRGYPLSRAVLAGDTTLVAFLRAAGADPSERDFLAVEIAIKRRDLSILRLLIDGPHDTTLPNPTFNCKPPADAPRPHKRQKPNTPSPATKVVPVRLTQPLIDAALIKGTPEIIQYIIHEKGYMPSLRSIVKLK